MAKIEEIKYSIYRGLADAAQDGGLKSLLESLAESKGRHRDMITALAERVGRDEGPILKASPDCEALAKRASWILRNLERKKEIAPTIRSKMLMIEFLQRTEEESFDFHRSMKGCAREDSTGEMVALTLEEEKEVENLRELAVRMLSFI